MAAGGEERTAEPVDVLAAADPVAAVLAAHDRGAPLALRTSGTTGRPRSVVRTTASWVHSFPAVSRLTGIDGSATVWVPGPPAATMNLFAAVHARWAGADVVATPERATHAHLTPAALARCLDEGADLAGRHVVVAGDRLPRALAERATAAGLRVSSYYGAAELSFVAWGASDADLRVFPGVEVEIREGRIWVRSPFLSQGYLGAEGPWTVAADGFATVGDRGRLDGDLLTVTGRGGDAVQTGAATVLVDDVEHALRTACGAEVVVVGVPSPRWGQVVGAVLTDRSALTAARTAARSELAPAQRPRLWFCLPRWPVTGAGKVDRAAVAAIAASGALTPVPPGREAP